MLQFKKGKKEREGKSLTLCFLPIIPYSVKSGETQGKRKQQYPRGVAHISSQAQLFALFLRPPESVSEYPLQAPFKSLSLLANGPCHIPSFSLKVTHASGWSPSHSLSKGLDVPHSAQRVRETWKTAIT